MEDNENETTENMDGLNEESEYDDPLVRRKVRADYRMLHNDIEEQGEEVIHPDSTKLMQYFEKGEALFQKVRHPREAVQDSTFLLTLTKKSREQAQHLKTDVVSFDNCTFAEKLISYVNGRHVTSDDKEDVDLSNDAWKKLGDRAASCFKTTPKFDFLLGPLVIEVVVKEKRVAERRQKVPEGEVLKLKQIDSVEKQEEATTKEVERVYKLLKKATQGGKSPVCLFRFIINPDSFGQTIENLFHFSFLVKDGRVIVDLDEDELPIVNLHKEYREKDYEEIVSRKQVVMPLNMRDWKELIDVYGITESMIPTRKSVLST
ncbi:non-structural maintenance of chromosomes element 4 homolog A-like [Hydractinia symbiolongicarpus]|uniref:non-structural maintenance of chromosomes element 4 homolog A-like n=1 Tax=Hydractinia symbiolongicarpus TaxID=13093 RepID=UPI00254E63BF|nr:non-structural maintenance of chromosomes element 4 homolog A-like [Hydractinia symbiolongicarpus]